MTKPHRIVVPLFDDMNAIDIAGPTEAFANVRDAHGQPCYTITTWSADGEAVRAESGLLLQPHKRQPATASGYILLVPGGPGARQTETLANLSSWVRRNHERFEHVVSVCTGAYPLAETGLLDGRRVATHWAHAHDLQQRYPKIAVDADALYVQDGRFHTSGGVTSGIDLALEMIGRDFGQKAVSDVARELVVYIRRSGKQSQFSKPLQLQARATDTLAEACQWAATHLQENLSVEALAERAHLSSRQFSRLFTQTYGESPGNYIRRLRVDAARQLLSDGVHIKQVAGAVGFTSQDGFRRAFERLHGISPLEYQKRFATQSGDTP